jgi:hypothetical protein
MYGTVLISDRVKRHCKSGSNFAIIYSYLIERLFNSFPSVPTDFQNDSIHFRNRICGFDVSALSFFCHNCRGQPSN